MNLLAVAPRQRGSILVGLLWCLAILSLLVVGVLHTAHMDLVSVKNYGDRIQAHYLAVAGIEKARALLYRDAQDRSRNQKNHTGDLYDADTEFRDIPFGRGTFSLIHRGKTEEGGGMLFGVSDEESRLNLNVATAEELTQLPNLTPDVAQAIVNWHGGDNTAAAAETQYYGDLKPPYQPRLGPYQTVRELLMVRGVTAADLLGRDQHQNGISAEAEDNQFAYPGTLETEDLGWAGVLTVDSSVQNLNAAGEQRVNIQTADESTLATLQGITPPMARAIVSYRNQHRFQSIVDLLDVTPPANQRGGLDGNGAPGGQVISQNLFMELADKITVDNNPSLTGAININTASLTVLMCLPGMTRELAQGIIRYRQSDGFFANIGELLKVSNMTADLLKGLAPLLTTRSETYRLLSEGRIKSSGVRQRVQAIIHVGLTDQKVLAWREDDL